MAFGAELDGSEDFFQMFWPTIISHKIGTYLIFPFLLADQRSVLPLIFLDTDRPILDEESPLYEVSARDISTKMQFEIILTVEGITPETGNTIQVYHT